MEDEEIQKALKELKDLGYDDTEPWLAQLVKFKKGNVEEVLRALCPKGKFASQSDQEV